MIRWDQKARLIEVLMTIIKRLEAAGGVSTFIGNAKSQIGVPLRHLSYEPITWRCGLTI